MAATAFSINNRGFVMSGFDPDLIWYDDVWEYSSFDGVTGWKETKNNPVSIYPNPAYNFIKVKSPFNINKVEVYNHVGTAVIKRDFSSNEITLKVSDLGKGLFIIRIRGNNAVYEKKILIDSDDN